MTLLTQHTLDCINPRDFSVVFALVPWFGARYVMDDNIIMQYVCDDHLPDDIPLFTLDCNDFCSYMCAADTGLKTP